MTLRIMLRFSLHTKLSWMRAKSVRQFAALYLTLARRWRASLPPPRVGEKASRAKRGGGVR